MLKWYYSCVRWLRDASSFFKPSCAPDAAASVDPPSDVFDEQKSSLVAYWSASDAWRRTLSAGHRTRPMLAKTTVELWTRETQGEIWCTERCWVRPMPVLWSVRCPWFLPNGSIRRGISIYTCLASFGTSLLTDWTLETYFELENFPSTHLGRKTLFEGVSLYILWARINHCST
jgi:hypothetical protein